LAALGLELAELFEGFFELAGEALAVHAQGREGSDLVRRSRGRAVVFERGDAVESPRRVNEGLHELFLEDADGFEVVEELLCEVLVRVEILGGEDDRVAGQAMSHGVQARTLLVGFGFRAG